MAKSITLLIPGLFDNLPDSLPHVPVLETLLARADFRSDLPVSYERTLMHLFSQPQSPERDVPEGALNRYAQTGEKPDGVWVCAAPVHLFADQSRVYLNTIDEATLSESEAAQLISELNKVYREDGWEFVQHTSTRWYLHILEEPNICTTPLREVDGKPIHDKFPQGNDALQWHRILNEMQMLLHASPVNQARQESGEVVANGVWLWGVGNLPDKARNCRWQSVWTNFPLAQGLCLLNGITAYDPPPGAEDCLQQREIGKQLVVIAPSMNDSRRDMLQQLERDWFVPLVASVKDGAIDVLTLDCANSRQWQLSRRALWRLWRRKQCLSCVMG